MKVVAGLGNPGKKYAGTRHNVGFDVLAELARRAAAGNWKSQFEAEVNEIVLGGQKTLLLAPQTFMNLSGRSIRKCVDFFHLPLADLLVISDDLNLSCGRLRLRGSGSAGGQKGLQNTIDQLGTPDFARLRIGIDRPPERMDTVNYVLRAFSKAERVLIEEAVQRAADAVEAWITEGLEPAMSRFNRDPSAEES